MNAEPMWVKGNTHADSHAVFRGRLPAGLSGDIKILVYASCPFLLYLDGKWIGEGPIRWAAAAPEYQGFAASLNKDSHVVVIHAHYEGVATRMMDALQPFVLCEVLQGVTPVPLEWKAETAAGFSSEVRRINPQFGWIDWLDTRETAHGWQGVDFDDVKWPEPQLQEISRKAPSQSPIHFPVARLHSLKAMKRGVLTEGFGYDADDPPAQLFLRDLEARHGPPQGVWRRYDLGRVRLGRPLFTLDLPRGAVVEFALSESLAHERVSPWITLSGGPSCNMDRFVARGGRQEFMPTTVKAGRYLEVHVMTEPKQTKFVNEQFAERSYHGEPEGSFRCSDKRLERIWSTGVDTYRACSEDSVIDNPTRERGEWIGDSLTVGLENAAVAYSDLSLFRKALRQAAVCARDDGLVAGLCPGTVSFISTYACHWVTAGLRIFEMTGDMALLKELFPAAERNMKAFSAKLTDEGLVGDLGWAFIDWGYVGSGGPSDMGLNMIYFGALRSMAQWCHAIGADASEHTENAARVEAAIRKYLAAEFGKPNPWPSIGIQRAALALRVGLIDSDRIPACVQFIKAHYRSCFPNDLFAPHLADPSTAQPRLITPFFSHFALQVLWQHGEGKFVLDQYRTCWGWALDQGLTTWPEVFDLRWSHCHQWSGCPTWQLTRYVFGLSARQDLGPNTFDFSPRSTSLEHARATIPIPETSHTIEVTYRIDDAQAVWVIESATPIRLRIGDKIIEVLGRFEHKDPHRRP